MDANRILAITAVIGIMLTLLTIVGGGGYALAELRASDARLADRMERLENRMERLENWMERLENRVEDRMKRLEETVERNHRELQHALGNHYHDETGEAVFTFPPGTE